MLFAVSSGDGNDGVSRMFPDYTFEAENLDAAVKSVMADLTKWERENVEEDGDENEAILSWTEGPAGETAFNGAAWKIIEIYPADE